MFKYGVLPICFLLLLPISFAEITLELPSQQHYNAGDHIAATIAIKESEDYTGFFKLQIECDAGNVQYYVSPLTVHANKEMVVPIPEIVMPEGVTGTCRLRADFEKGNKEKISAAISKSFQVSNSVSINLFENNKVKPGDIIVVSADIAKTNGELIDSGTAMITLHDYSGEISFEGGKLQHTIDIGYVARGFYDLVIKINDGKGNFGELSSQIEVIGTPKRIENKLNKKEVSVDSSIGVTPILYDQTDVPLEKTVLVEILNKKEKTINSKEIISGNVFTLEIDNLFSPGRYFVRSSFENVIDQTPFSVKEVKTVSMKTKGHIVWIKNTGNVRFKDEVTLSIVGEEKTILINKKLDLKVDEENEFDISKYVPAGMYTLSLPDGFDSSGITGQISVPDNRNALSKGISGFASISGAAVKGTVEVITKPLVAGVIMFILIGAILVRYGKRLLPAKKKDKTDDLFKDFDFEK